MKDSINGMAQWLDTLSKANTSGATAPFSGFLKHLESDKKLSPLIETLRSDDAVKATLAEASYNEAPKLRTLEEVASACVLILTDIRDNKDFLRVFQYGVDESADARQGEVPAELIRRYIRPLLAYMELRSSSHSVLEEYRLRCSTLFQPQFYESSFRLAGLYQWLMANPFTQTIATSLLARQTALDALAAAGDDNPLQAENPVDTAAIGLYLMKECVEGENLFQLTFKYGIWPPNASTRLQAHCNVLLDQYVYPAIKHIEDELSVLCPEKPPEAGRCLDDACVPLEIRDSLAAFKTDHPEPTAFIMMQFTQSAPHNQIVATIKSNLAEHGITALRADDHQYHDDVFPNVKTYMHGCDFGVAVFERIADEVFNPNVSLEVGYMLALGKPICYIKDKSLKRLPTDLISKLYREFDTHAIETTLPMSLTKWLQEKRIGRQKEGAL
jgi:hypothetical protein